MSHTDHWVLHQFWPPPFGPAFSVLGSDCRGSGEAETFRLDWPKWLPLNVHGSPGFYVEPVFRGLTHVWVGRQVLLGV